jgi:diguanylate cyclase (GGDEF)-like protein/PAS domain S-box-containing protein
MENDNLRELRERAENKLKNYERGDSFSEADTQKLIYDLEVYRVELEMQNEELKEAKAQLELSRDHFASLFNSSPVGIAILDKNGVVLESNNTLSTMLNLDKEKILHKSFATFLHPENQSEYMSRYKAFFKSPSGKSIEAVLVGGNIYVQLSAVKTTGFADNLLINITDITERKLAEELLKESKEELRLFFDHMLAGVAIHEMIYDQDGKPIDYRFLNVNRKFEELTGLYPDDIIGKTVKEVLPDTEQYWIDTYGKVAKTGGSLDYENYSAEVGKYFSVVVFSPRQDRFATVFVDITERKIAEEKIIHIGFHDQLTDLYNRHYFEACEEELKDIPVLSVIMTDVNGLKLVNDTYGHEAGDELLKKYAELLRKSFKQSDLIFRWGGDEFIVILKNTREAKSWELCNRLNKHCGETFVKDIPLSISVGISSKLDGGDIDEAIKEAENMMYKNKLTESKSSKNLIMKTLQQTLSEKSFETKEHIDRMTMVGRQFGERLGLPPSELSRLETLTMLHDIGKINLDSHVLLKETALTEHEWEEIKKHPEVGYRITRTTEEFAYIAEEILAHHERWDGKGYPQCLKGESIPHLARLLNIIDSYDVMNYGRPYKKKMSLNEIIEEIKRCSGKQFDPDLVEEFVACLQEGVI